MIRSDSRIFPGGYGFTISCSLNGLKKEKEGYKWAKKETEKAHAAI